MGAAAEERRRHDVSCPRIPRTRGDRCRPYAPLRASEVVRIMASEFSTGGAGEKSRSEMAALMRSVASRERSLIKLDAEQQAAGGYGGPPLTVHDRAFKLGGALRSPDCPAGGVRIDGSGTRASSLLDRVERDATPCLLITLVCGAFCRRPTTLLGTWRPRRTARGSLLANVWCRSFSCGSGQSAVSESSSGWEFAVQFRLGIDIMSSRAPSQPRR